MNVVHIRFSHDLPTRTQNELRGRMEMAEWKRRWREAEAEGDHYLMDRLQEDYEWVGLP